MTLLARLKPEAGRLVTPALASGEVDRLTPEACAALVEPMGRPLSLEALDGYLDRLVATSPRHDSAIDEGAGPALHRALPLTRREAAEPGIWRYLAVVHRPDFVRHRWENKSWATMRTRFWSFGTRPDSNAFCRLWWIAELTRSGSSYELTARVLRRQPLATNIFVRAVSFYRPAVQACVDVLEDAPAPVIEATMLRLSRFLGLTPLESLSEAELADALQRLRPSGSEL